MHTPSDAELPNFDVATPVEKGLAFRDQSRPHLKGGGSQRFRILGVYEYTLSQTTKFDVVTHVGKERVSWGHPRLPYQNSGVIGYRLAPQISGFSCIYAYTL